MSFISKLNTITAYPLVLKTIGKKVYRGFVKDFLIVKAKTR